MENLIVLISVGLSSIFMVTIFFRFTLSEIGWNAKYVSMILFLSLSIWILIQTPYSWIQYLSTALIFVIYIQVYDKEIKLIESLFLAIFTILLASFINFTEQTLVSILFQVVYHEYLLVFVSNLLLLIVNIFVIIIIPNSIFSKAILFLKQRKIIYGCIIWLFLLLSLFISLVSSDNNTGLIDLLFLNNRSIAVLFLSVGFFVILMILIIGVHIEEKKDSDKLLNSLSLYTADIERINEELAMFRHDYKNLLYSLKIAIDNENINEIKNIYEDVLMPTSKFIENEEFEISKLNKLKNLEIKAIVSLKYSFAKQKKLIVNLDIPESFVLTQTEYLVTTIRILSILLDNAIEASLLSKEKLLFISFFSANDTKYIIISNSFNDKIHEKVGKQRYTAKQDLELHGWGLLYLNKVIRNDSYFDLITTIENHIFTQNLSVSNQQIK